MKVMMSLLGTKNPSAPVGDKSGGDGRAARSLLSCALWRGMGRLWRGMGGGRPPHRQHGLSGFHETRDPAIARRAASASANSEVFTRHESRPLCFSSHDFPRFPGISHDFPAPPTPLGKGPRAVRSLLSCSLWCGIGRLWRGMGGGRPPRRQHGHSCSPAVRYFFWSELACISHHAAR